jgi:endonuclease/exonuclease/phosphatase family metal-dependent hydrolase
LAKSITGGNMQSAHLEERRKIHMNLARKFSCFAITVMCSFPGQAAEHTDTQIKVMSFNTWGAGTNAGKDISETLAVIRAVNPDLIGLQEIRPESTDCTAEDCPAGPASVAPQLAEALGYHLLEQLTDNEVLWANAILSRFPIKEATPGMLGARITVGDREVLLFNIHTTDYPYQPFQLLSIPYGDAVFLGTAEEAVASARQARDGAMALLQADITAAGPAALTLITGDFNEPSFRDWTAATAAAGVHPLEVAWPFTRKLEELGFVDVFRSAYPDPLSRPGFTWSPNIGPQTTDDHKDRIDFIFARAQKLQIKNAAVVGEPGPYSDVQIAPFPSDHRAVTAVIRF